MTDFNIHDHYEADSTPADTHKVFRGDKVRSFDFEHRRDCYVEGYITGLTISPAGYPVWVIRVTRKVAAGKDRDHSIFDEIRPPVNGVKSLFGDTGYTNGIEKIQ